MQISIEVAYQKACQIIGDSTVKEQILVDALAAKDLEIAALREQLVAAGVIEEATEIVEGADGADRSQQQGVENNGKVAGEPPQS